MSFKYEDVEKQIGYIFQNKELLKQAFVHSSYAHENKNSIFSYERLEFLGDAILEMVSSIYLYKNNPIDDEGTLTKTRAKMVCTTSLSNIALELNIAQYILLGKGELNQNIEERYSILEDVIEAIIGAIFLDGGFENAEKFIYDNILSQKTLMFRDYKSEVQEILQAKAITNIQYEIIKEEGPEHNKTFTCVLKVNGENKTLGSGKTKKAANQDAAKNYIELEQ